MIAGCPVRTGRLQGSPHVNEALARLAHPTARKAVNAIMPELPPKVADQLIGIVTDPRLETRCR